MHATDDQTTNHDLQDILGEGVMAEWFRLARKGAPRARLLLNEYNLLAGGHAW